MIFITPSTFQLRIKATVTTFQHLRIEVQVSKRVQPFDLYKAGWDLQLLQFPCTLLSCSRMEETTPPERANTILVIGLVALLVKGGECGELVLPSLPPLVRRTEGREELVCGTELTGRQSSPAGTVSLGTWGEEEQEGGRGRAWQYRLPIAVEDNICSEPHLEVDREEEPKTVPVQLASYVVV